MVAKKKTAKTQKKSSKSVLSPSRSMVYEVQLELSKLRREKSIIVLNKAIFLYFFFIFFSVISLLTGFQTIFNVLVILGLMSVIVGSVPYIRTMYAEERNLTEMIQDLKKYH